MSSTSIGRQRIAAIAATAALVFIAVARFREAVLTFYFLDDFWVMRDAARVQLESIADVAQFFQAGHAGFALYRPLTTVVYAYLLRALFGYDASGYHAFQLLVFALNVVLAFAITRRLTGSIAAAFASGLIYTLAPGQAVNAFWLSAFTVTGTATWMLLLMWAWLAAEGWARVVSCTAIQILGLLASEHALVGPVLVALLATVRREPLGRTASAVAPLGAIVIAYLGAKLWYFRFVRPPAAAYAVALDPLGLLGQIGQYFTACFNVLAVQQWGASAFLWLGLGLLVLLLFAAWRGASGAAEWRLAAAGIAMFVVSLGPVVVLRAHYFDHYICLAAFGAALAAIGCCRALTRYGNALAFALAMSLLVYDRSSGERAWRQNRTFQLVLQHQNYSAGWIAAVQNAAAERPGTAEVFVPLQPVTKDVFVKGMVDTYFPGLPRTTLYAPGRRPPAGDGRLVLSGARILRRDERRPGEDPGLDWLRALAAYPERRTRPGGAARAQLPRRSSPIRRVWRRGRRRRRRGWPAARSPLPARRRRARHADRRRSCWRHRC